MPKVDTFGNAEVFTQPVRGARAQSLPSGSFDLGAQALSNVGNIMAQEKQRADTSAAEEALVNFDRAKIDLFSNPETGYFNLAGKNAVDGADAARKSLEDLQREFSTSLESDDARRLFDRASTAVVTRSQGEIARHSSKNLKAYEVATSKATAENALENATIYWQDPDQLGVYSALGEQSVIDAAKLQGIDHQEPLESFRSAFAMSAITSALNTSSADADKLMEKYGRVLEGPDKLVMDNRIEKRKAAEHTANITSQAVAGAQHMTQLYGELPNARQLINEELAKIKDPELQKATQKEADYKLGQIQEAKLERNAAMQEDGLKFQQAGGSLSEWKAQNPDQWEELSTKQQKILEAGSPVVTDVNEFTRVMMLPDSQKAKINPAEYADRFSTADVNRLRSSVMSARDGTGDQVGRTRASQVKSAVDSLFDAPKDRNDNEQAGADAFNALVNSELNFREGQKGASLSSEEFTEMIGDLTRKVLVEDAGFAFFDADQTIADVPTEDVKAISDFLHQNNIPVTAENLIRAHQQASN